MNSRHRTTSGRRTRASIALFVDTDTWAFASIARQVMRYLSDYYSFRLIPGTLLENLDQLIMISSEADLRHFFWRGALREVGSPENRAYVERLGWDYDAFEARFMGGRRLTTTVCDHLWLSDEEVSEWIPFYQSPLLNGYGVSSRRLFDIYSSLPACRPPSALLEDGVDLGLFTPRASRRSMNTRSTELVVGWVGNSAWGGSTEDVKGVRTVIRPALNALRARGIPIRGLLADSSVRRLPHVAMPDFYAQIDVLVCASHSEGTPLPVLEAMASGVPVVSTDVGVVPDALGPLQQRFILPERTIEALADRLCELARHRSLLRDLSRENLDHVREWGWDKKAYAYCTFFEHVLDGPA